MRLDKFISNAGVLSRSQCAKECRAGNITCDGMVIRDPSANVDPQNSVIAYKGEAITYSEYVYIMMNKPLGYVCSNDEPGELLVFDLLDERYRKKDLFTVGRLDKNTSGLIIITNDGKSAHNALSPKHHVEKKYEFALADPLSEEDRISLEKGAELADGYITKPSKIIMKTDKTGVIILSEGKYHQIRRMFASVSNKVVELKRTEFGGIILDGALSPGQWRLLTQQEITLFTNKR
ncbi:MAG: rRNA pseudouridine synthase [Clostridia bacterium]|nr:rRNA pseudouridine synthase [Clostridia bacterium]